MANPRTVLALTGAATAVALIVVVVDVLGVGGPAAFSGDYGTVYEAVAVLLFVAVTAGLLAGLRGG